MKSRKMDVPEPIWRWLHTVKAELKEERGRTVTLPETWEHIKAAYESKIRLNMGHILQEQADAERRYG